MKKSVFGLNYNAIQIVVADNVEDVKTTKISMTIEGIQQSQLEPKLEEGTKQVIKIQLLTDNSATCSKNVE